MSCQYGSSVVGTWTLFVDWACRDAPNHGSMTFDIDGTWSARKEMEVTGFRLKVWSYGTTLRLPN